jgi:hypothetical protein
MGYRTVLKCVYAGLLCVAAGAASAETFVIQAVDSGREATIRIPVGAVAKLSANSCESLVGYGDPQFESMRLSGDVLISIAGSERPIQIKADKIVLELTADSLPGAKPLGRGDALGDEPSSSTVLTGANNSRVFLGNVVFNLETRSGPVEIKADRVEHQVANSG